MANLSPCSHNLYILLTLLGLRELKTFTWRELIALVIVQSRLHWPRDPSGVGKADQMQFGVPRKSDVYSIGLETADAVTETRDAQDLELSELSTEAREVKLDFPVE